jgi:hypothetical protein
MDQLWHNNLQTEKRKIMKMCIVELIKTLNEESLTSSSSPELSDDAEAILLEIAQLIEVYLYQTAKSFDGYFDMNTLIHRIQHIADRLVNIEVDQTIEEGTENLAVLPSKGSNSKSGQGHGQGVSRVFILKGKFLYSYICLCAFSNQSFLFNSSLGTSP